MSTFFDRHIFVLIGTCVLVVYALLVAAFVKRQSRSPDAPIKWWWHVVIGPPALLRWYSNRLGRTSLLSARESFGWILVIILMVGVIAWKLLD